MLAWFLFPGSVLVSFVPSSLSFDGGEMGSVIVEIPAE